MWRFELANDVTVAELLLLLLLSSHRIASEIWTELHSNSISVDVHFNDFDSQRACDWLPLYFFPEPTFTRCEHIAHIAPMTRHQRPISHHTFLRQLFEYYSFFGFLIINVYWKYRIGGYSYFVARNESFKVYKSRQTWPLSQALIAIS